MALILGASSAVVAKESPLEVAKKFLKDTVPAPCATIAIGECDNGYCWGEKEAFVFQIKDETLANPFVRSFRPYTTDGETFTPTVRLENNADTETLTLELFQQAWAPALPDEDGIDHGVLKYVFVIRKKMSSNDITYAEENTFLRKRSFFWGRLSKKWNVNAPKKICQ
jgi:hypothetical protein